MTTRILSLVFALSLYGVGCSDKSGETGEGEGEGEGEALSHATDIQPIWDANCDGCHIGGGASGGMALDDGYTSIVSVASTELSSMNRVEPGDPANSYLLHKLEGTHESVGGSGVQMPKGGALSADDIATVEAWISGGALP